MICSPYSPIPQTIGERTDAKWTDRLKDGRTDGNSIPSMANSHKLRAFDVIVLSQLYRNLKTTEISIPCRSLSTVQKSQ